MAWPWIDFPMHPETPPAVPYTPPWIPPVGHGKNPKGGGGDQWEPMRIERQGNFGVQRTFVGKVVHKRPRHYFSRADYLRISKNIVAEVEQASNGEFDIWEFIMDTTTHLFNGVGALEGAVGQPTIQNFIKIFDWFRANKAWADEWRPKTEAAFEKFWEEINGETTTG